MIVLSYGGGISVWQKQKPHRRFGGGVWKILVNQSEPGRQALQKQQPAGWQQSVVQIAIH